MLNYSQMKMPGFYWLYPPANSQQEPVIVEVGGRPGAHFVLFTGKTEPVKLEDVAGELVGPLHPYTIITCT